MSAVGSVEVLEGGLATVQDGGRPGWARLGVPPGGACDPSALEVANALLGNALGRAAIEIPLGGFAFKVLQTMVVAIGGADLGAVRVERDEALAANACHMLRAGQSVRFLGRPSGVASGARAYLAVAGGFRVPQVLGSSGTSIEGGFGGLDGRVLRAGDVLQASAPSVEVAAGRRWPTESRRSAPGAPNTVRVVIGPHARSFVIETLGVLMSSVWTVGPDSDRMGIRLEGPLIRRRRMKELVSLPMCWGAIQVTGNGMPVALLADHQTVGGYPVIAVAARVDRPVLGQLAPRDAVRFEAVTIEDAQAAWREDRASLRLALEQLATGEAWLEQWRWAGAWA